MPKPLRIIARPYDGNEPVCVLVDQGRIADIRPADVPEPETLSRIAPGLVDIQVNGYGGRDFLDPDLPEDGVAAVCRDLLAQGVTRFLPTVTTQSFERIREALERVDAACRRDPIAAQMIAGIHVEGPYLSSEDGPRGAHPAEHCRPPDWEEFSHWQAASGERIKLITLAPELPGSAEFIGRCVKSGVRVALGHTAADGDDIARAVSAGASVSTHLGNGAHGTIRRHPNYIWDQLAEDRLSATLIADGHHLPDAVLRCFLRAKGRERVALVSDMTSLAGQPPGHYETALGAVEVLEDGRLVVAGQRQYLAGASLPLLSGVENLLRLGLPLDEAWDQASIQPARLAGLPPAPLEIGAPADLTLFDRAENRLTVRGVFLRGELLHGDPL